MHLWYSVIISIGSTTRTRTWNLVVNSHPLCRLSYRGIINASYYTRSALKCQYLYLLCRCSVIMSPLSVQRKCPSRVSLLRVRGIVFPAKSASGQALPTTPSRGGASSMRPMRLCRRYVILEQKKKGFCGAFPASSASAPQPPGSLGMRTERFNH